MSVRTARRILWVTFVLVVPAPILLLSPPGTLPPAGFLELGGASLAVLMVESAQGVVRTLTTIFLAQGFIYSALLWIPAALLARLLGRRRGIITLLLVVALLLVTAIVPVYHTPYHARSAHVTLLEVYR